MIINAFESEEAFYMKYKIIDLSHEISSQSPYWDEDSGATVTTNSAGNFTLQIFCFPAGFGTHIDSPAHYYSFGKTVIELELANKLFQVVVIDVSSKVVCHNYLITKQDVLDHEEKFGKIEKSCEIANGLLVFFYTGWAARWGDKQKYRNNLVFPSLSKEAAEYLLPKIDGIGVDTLSPDLPNTSFPVHELLLGNDKFILENVNLSATCAILRYVIISPLKIVGAVESPVQITGFCDLI